MTERSTTPFSGGIAELGFLPATSVVDFDHALTGRPLGLEAGAELIGQFLPDLGFRVTGMPWRASSPAMVIALDTAAPRPATWTCVRRATTRRTTRPRASP